MSSLRLRFQRRVVDSDRPALVFLVVLATAMTVTGIVSEDLVPQVAMLLPMFLGSLWLWPRTLPWYVLYCLVGVVVLSATQPVVSGRSVVRVAVTFGIGLLIMVSAYRRSRLGVSGVRGESMFVDLRDRIARQGVIPRLPESWLVESAIRTANGTSFSGDFVVASRANDGTTLDLVVVDVSGKGVEAGTRSLLLSGAFGALVSAVDADRFLLDANDYLLRQQWPEGFATAVHVHLDLETGEAEIRTAGHPPAIWLHDAGRRSAPLETDGMVLGIEPGTGRFEPARVRLEPGDALLLYTDGLVEVGRHDISTGIDRLARRGEAIRVRGFAGAAQRLLDDLASRTDDAAVVLVHRKATTA